MERGIICELYHRSYLMVLQRNIITKNSVLIVNLFFFLLILEHFLDKGCRVLPLQSLHCVRQHVNIMLDRAQQNTNNWRLQVKIAATIFKSIWEEKTLCCPKCQDLLDQIVLVPTQSKAHTELLRLFLRWNDVLGNHFSSVLSSWSQGFCLG